MSASLVVPAVAGAAGLTNDQVTAIVSLLQSFGADTNTVADVQKVLQGQPTESHELRGNVTTAGQGIAPGLLPPGQMGKLACVLLSRDLAQGSKGDDVKKLQQMLAADTDSGFTAPATGVFGPATAKAMVKFQMKHGISSNTNGRVGPMTRGFFERSCGKGIGDNQGQNIPVMHIGGTITASTGSSIVVQNLEGKSIRVNITASTTIIVLVPPTTSSSTVTLIKPTAGSVADLVIGKMVMVEGRPRTDNSINALRITVGTMIPPPHDQAILR